jgi:hypothetical protein
MHRGLPCSCSVLTSSTCAASDGSLRPCFAWSNANMQVSDTDITCNAWSAKCIMMHDHEHLNHINPYKLFTKLPYHF